MKADVDVVRSQHERWLRAPVLGLVGLAIGLGPVGCANVRENPDAIPSSEAADAAIPAFSGPWASEFESAYAEATTSFEREILQDGVITEAEYAEMREGLQSCLFSQGFEEVEFSPRGGMSVVGPDSISGEEQLNRAQHCSETSGEATIGALYSWIRRNPEHLDDATIVVECLLRHAAVRADYSAVEYGIDMPNDAVPILPGVSASVLSECSEDPLGVNPLHPE